MSTIRTHWLQILTHILALFPLATLVWDFAQGQLGANPIREIQLRTGKDALTLLVLTLLCTPASTLPQLKRVLALRRSLGLYAFVYASLHFLNFIGLDYGFQLDLIREDMFEKRYALIGLAAFLCLIPLAVTSTKGWIRRLGRNWERLHRLAYLSGLLAVLHFALQAKANIHQPIFYGVVVVLLLIARMAPGIRKAIGRRHRQPVAKNPGS